MRARHITLAAITAVAVGATTVGGTRFLQAPAFAQDGAAPAVVAPPKATVDAGALASLKAMSAAYKALDSYSATISNVDAMGKGGTESGTIQWAKPNRFAVKFGDDKNTTTAVSDGKTLYAASTADQKRYLKTSATEDSSGLLTSLSQSSAGNLLLPMLLSGIDIVQIFGLERPNGTMSVAKGEDGEVGGTAVEKVMATRPAGKNATIFTFSIGKDDHLLRQVEIGVRSEDGTMKPISTETHANVKTGGEIAATDLAFTPAEGAKAVESLAPPRYDESLKKGAMPIAFQAKDTTGKPVNLEQYKGKVVLLDFWATWCGPCVGEVPNIVANYEKYKGQGFDVLGISLDNTQAPLDKFVVEKKMPWRQVCDSKGWNAEVGKLYGVKSIPFALLIGRDGKIASMDVRGEALEPAIKAALAEKAPGAATAAASKPATAKKVVAAKPATAKKAPTAKRSS